MLETANLSWYVEATFVKVPSGIAKGNAAIRRILEWSRISTPENPAQPPAYIGKRDFRRVLCSSGIAEHRSHDCSRLDQADLEVNCISGFIGVSARPERTRRCPE